MLIIRGPRPLIVNIIADKIVTGCNAWSPKQKVLAIAHGKIQMQVEVKTHTYIYFDYIFLRLTYAR